MAYVFLDYGFAKIFKGQFTTSLSTLDVPLGQISAFQLAWRFFGYSYVYTIFLAASEIVGGVLLSFGVRAARHGDPGAGHHQHRCRQLHALEPRDRMTDVIRPVRRGRTQLFLLSDNWLYMPMPIVFISYAWKSGENAGAHREWVASLAASIRDSGAEVLLDQWSVANGESVTQFMETAITRADVVVVVCTPAFAASANARQGGVGYEQQIVSTQLLLGRRGLRVIPVLRSGDLHTAIPTFLQGRLHVDLRGEPSAAAMAQLIRDIHARPDDDPSPRTDEPEPPRTTPGPKRVPLVLGAALIIAGGSGLLWWNYRRQPVIEEHQPRGVTTTAEVAGFVRDRATQGSIENAIVEAQGVTTTSDSTGVFRLAVPHAGNVTVTVRRAGYRPASLTIEAPQQALPVQLDAEAK